MKLHELIRSLTAARSLLSETLSVQQLVVFSLVCEAGNGGTSQEALILRTDYPRPTVSKYLANFSRLLPNGEPGPELIEASLDPSNPRARVYKVTAKGQKIMQKILEGVEK